MIGNYLSPPRHNRNVWQDLADRLPAQGWKVLTTSSKEFAPLRLLDMLWTVFSKRSGYQIAQIDVFSGRAFTFAECCARLLRVLRKPFLLTLHGGALPAFAQSRSHRVRALLCSATRVVTPSPYLQQSLMELCPRIVHIPNPVQVLNMLYRRRSVLSPRLIWVRAFHETYNPTMAIRVLDLLRRIYPNCHLTMVGPDKHDGSLDRVMRLSSELGLSANLNVLPGVPSSDIPALLDSADIFINTTNYDTAPRSLMEAMGCGLCVVSTNVGGIPWLISEGHDGLLVPSNAPEEMAIAITRLLKDPILAEFISRNARLKAETFDWSAVLPQWDQLFTNVLIGARE